MTRIYRKGWRYRALSQGVSWLGKRRVQKFPKKLRIYIILKKLLNFTTRLIKMYFLYIISLHKKSIQRKRLHTRLWYLTSHYYYFSVSICIKYAKNIYAYFFFSVNIPFYLFLIFFPIHILIASWIPLWSSASK